MSKFKKILIIAAIIIVGILWFKLSSNKSENLVNPLPGQPKPTSSETPSPETPSPVPTSNVPKTFNFNSSTDLQAELEKVNPQVLDDDFKDL